MTKNKYKALLTGTLALLVSINCGFNSNIFAATASAAGYIDNGEAVAEYNTTPIVKSYNITSNSVNLKWSEVTNAEKYRILKYSNGKLYIIGETECCKAKIININPDTERVYIIRAYVDDEWTPIDTSSAIAVKTLNNK